MKRLLWGALAALVLGTGTARAGSIGVGLFGGASVPVLQDDQDDGSIYGVRIPVKLVPLITVEPYYASAQLGDKTFDIAPGITVTREGSEVYSYGVNGMLTVGGPLNFYPFVGMGLAKYERSGQEETFTSFQGGVGLAIHPVPKLGLDLRAELQAAAGDGGTARKLFNLTLGASYALFSLP